VFLAVTLSSILFLTWLLRPRLELGLLLLVATLPFERIGSYELYGLTVRPSQLIAVALIISLLFKWRENRLRRDLELLPLIYLGAAAISVAFAPATIRALLVLGFSFFAWLAFLTVRRLTAHADLRLLERALWWTTFAVIVFGLYQYLGDSLGLQKHLTGLKDYYTKEVFGFPRIQSFALEPLYLANFLLIPLGLFGARFTRRPDRRSGLLLFLLSLTIALTLSRGGYAAAVWVIFLLIFSHPQLRATLRLLGLISAGVIAGLLLISLGSAVKKEETLTQVKTFTAQATNVETGASVSERAQARRDAWEAFRESPLTGIGAGNFGTWAHARNPEISKDAIVNNEPLELLAETGVFGFAAITAFVLAILRRSWRAFRSGQGSEEERVWLIGLTAAVIGFAVQYQTFSTLYVMHIWVALGLLVAIQDRVLLAEARGNKQKPISNKRKAAL
jgi:O-antigen ligase